MHVELHCNPLELPEFRPSPRAIEARDYMLGWHEEQCDDDTVAQFDMRSDNRILLSLTGVKKSERIPLDSSIGDALVVLRSCHIDALGSHPQSQSLAGTYQLFIEGMNVRLAGTDARHVDVGSPCVMRYTGDDTYSTEGYRGAVSVPVDEAYGMLPFGRLGYTMRRDILNKALARMPDEEFRNVEAIQMGPWIPVVFAHLRDVHRRMAVPGTQSCTRMVGSLPTNYSL